METMEESHDMHCQRENFYSDKSKRRFKTPAQVQALERFYDEHMYPSETMKLQLAEQIGLSEKQVSGWFCHRRSKDKKLLQSQDEGFANIKQNLSTGTIHDSASGLRQESCNSTKQTDRPFDGKEVESNMLHCQKKSSAIPEKRAEPAYVECYKVSDDRSSGSSTTSYERLLKHGVHGCTMKPSYSLYDENCLVADNKGVKKSEHVMDSRSQHLQGYVESRIVSLVKLKLGEQYHEDGPQLAVDFDPLPPGAFDSPVRDSNTEPYYLGDSIQPRTCSVHLVVEEPKMHDKYRCERISNGSHLHGGGYDRKLRSLNHQSDFNGYKLAPNASLFKRNEYGPNRTFIMDTEGKDAAEEVSDDYGINNLRYVRNRSTMISDSRDSNLFRSNGLEANVNIPCTSPVPGYDNGAPISQREFFKARISKPMVKSRRKEYLDTEDCVQPRGALRVLKKKIYKHANLLENCNSVWPQMLMTTDSKVNRKVHGRLFRSKMLN